MMSLNSEDPFLQFSPRKSVEENSRKSILEHPPASFNPEELLADELKELSYDDRLRIDEERHGVGSRAVKETPQMVELSLSVFDTLLNNRRESDPSCMYVLRNVIRCWPTPQANGSLPSNCYLNDMEVRLRFLRCECFDVEKAVQRFIDFIKFMSELFGDFVAERPVQLSDFSREEEACLMQSRNQFLPFRDRSGRRVLAGVGNCNFHMDMKMRYKIFMYMFWVASEDIETQIKGAVILCWAFDEKNDTTWENKIRAGMPKDIKNYHEKQNKALPVRITSWQHYYKDTPYFRLLANLYVFSVVRNSPYRTIFKIHFGSEVELKYKLSGYGIPVELLPMSSTGTLKFDNHRDWVNVIRTKAKLHESHRDDVMDCPRTNDVVYRKGPASKHNTGNAYYRDLIEDYSLEHFTADRNKKYDITMLVIQKIRNRGGRFLEWKNMWVVYQDEEVVRKKIASAFKQFNRNRKASDESEQLVQAIDFATTIDEEHSSQPKRPITVESAEEPRPENLSIISSSMEYAFVENPAKRLKTRVADNDEDDCATACIQLKDDDIVCFGKCFIPTDFVTEDLFE